MEYVACMAHVCKLKIINLTECEIFLRNQEICICMRMHNSKNYVCLKIKHKYYLYNLKHRHLLSSSKLNKTTKILYNIAVSPLQLFM